jgi:hypothetical protein
MKNRYILAGFGLLVFLGWAPAGEIEKGVPEAPANMKALAGSYYCGDGKAYNVTLVLKGDGSYSGEWSDCTRVCGKASGTWTLSDKRVVLRAKDETDMMKGHLRTLEVFRFKGGWILVRAEDKASYEGHGVSRFTCFQRGEQK